ncbi:MAG: hypothetical protein WD558_04510, partial [Pseudomonadales bacterium]
HKDFLDELEVSRMTKSYKMILLLGMIAESKFPGAIDIISLCKQVKRISSKHPALRAEIGKAVDNDTSLMQLMVDNPIKAWTGGRGTVGAPFFDYSEKVFRSFDVEPEHSESIRELTREICDYRIAEYLNRNMADQSSVKQNNSN